MARLYLRNHIIFYILQRHGGNLIFLTFALAVVTLTLFFFPAISWKGLGTLVRSVVVKYHDHELDLIFDLAVVTNMILSELSRKP